MTLSLEDRAKELHRLIDELIANNRTVPVIVEGKRDVRALRSLGLEGEILTLNGGISRIEFCDRLAERTPEAILLTDWDRTGGTIARHLRLNLKGRVRLDGETRKNLAFYSEVSAVEELPGYVDGLDRRVYGDPRRSSRRHDEEE